MGQLTYKDEKTKQASLLAKTGSNFLRILVGVDHDNPFALHRLGPA